MPLDLTRRSGMGQLILTCRTCTRQHRIGCSSQEQGELGAKMLGWVWDGYAWICPRCPAIRRAKTSPPEHVVDSLEPVVP